jgi:hypothetical protein
MNIQGVQCYTTSAPGFIWRGKTTLFTAIDRYFSDFGKLNVRLFSFIPMVNATGNHIDEGQLQRWVGEHFWYPTNLVNAHFFKWEPIDEHSSRLVFRYRNHVIPFTFHFGESGAITAVSCDRYKDADNKLPWTGYAMNYRRINQLMIPTQIKAVWHLPEGEYMYADFLLNKIDHYPKAD